MGVGGSAACWGADDNGELSVLPNTNHLIPESVFSGTHQLTGVAQITAGSGLLRRSFGLFDREHTCALMAYGSIFCWGFNGSGELGNGNTTSQPSPVAVNSFIANVDPAGALRSQRIAEITALVDCAGGGQARITLTLLQGAVTGTGHAEAKCTGDLERVPMSIEAHGPSGWQAGAATAQVEAIIHNEEDRVTDDTQWTRQVTLSPNF
jgi:hypothetical protein